LVATSLCFVRRPVLEDRDVLTRKPEKVPHADLIDLLLDADEPTRKLLLSQALQTGMVKKSEAEEIVAQVARLERAGAPRGSRAVAAQAA
jgi:hypothetical protein